MKSEMQILRFYLVGQRCNVTIKEVFFYNAGRVGHLRVSTLIVINPTMLGFTCRNKHQCNNHLFATRAWFNIYIYTIQNF